MNLARATKQLAIGLHAPGHHGRFRGPLHICLIVAAASAGLHAPAAAQQSGQGNAEPVATNSSQAPAGHIIYSRDVSYGSAIGPRTPGRVHTVNAGPTDLILSTLAAGLEPIGDDESASIIAGTNSQTALIGDQVGLGLGAISSMTGAGGSASKLGDIQSTATGGAMSQATGAIGNAMGTVRGILGNLPGGRP